MRRGGCGHEANKTNPRVCGAGAEKGCTQVLARRFYFSGKQPETQCTFISAVAFEGGQVMSNNNNPWAGGANGFDDALDLFENAEVGASEGASGPIKSGKYPAKLISGELEKARSGNTCFSIRWEIVASEYAGRRLVSRHWLTPKAVSRTKAELSALGIGGEHLRGVVPLSGVQAVLSVVARADETGDLFNEVKRVRPLDETERQAIAASRVPASSSEPVASTAAASGPVASPDPGVTDTPSPGPSDDDILDEIFGG